MKTGETHDLKTIHQRYFKALKQSCDKVKSYEMLIDREDDTIPYSMKGFDNEEDVNAHNDSPELEVFLVYLKKLLDGSTDYYEYTQIESL